MTLINTLCILNTISNFLCEWYIETMQMLVVFTDMLNAAVQVLFHRNSFIFRDFHLCEIKII